jgi:hypothetical protein
MPLSLAARHQPSSKFLTPSDKPDKPDIITANRMLAVSHDMPAQSIAWHML